MHRMGEKGTVKHVEAVPTMKEVQDFWEKARIPIRHFQHAVKKLEDLVGKWEALKKNKGRRSETQQKNEEEFKETLNHLLILFDVAHHHQDALKMIKISEDKAFLEAQREKGRRGSMVGVDLKLAKQEELKATKEQKKMKWIQKQRVEAERYEKTVVQEDSDSSSSARESDAEEVAAAAGPSKARKCTRGRKNLLSPDIL